MDCWSCEPPTVSFTGSVKSSYGRRPYPLKRLTFWEALAYNNLLGFPYRYGYYRGPLERLIEPLQFCVEGMLNSELLTLPLPEDPGWVVREEHNIQQGVQWLATQHFAIKKAN